MADTSKPLVLVLGATDREGSAVISQLLKEDKWRIRGVTYNYTDKARALAAKGVEVIQCNLENQQEVAAAVQDVHTVFAIFEPLDLGGGRKEEVVGRRFIEFLSKHSSVQHVIYSSWAGAGRGHFKLKVPHIESKFGVEQRVREFPRQWTIISPTFFMENFLEPKTLKDIKEKKVLRMPLPPNTKLMTICLDDVAGFAVKCINEPQHYHGQLFEVAADNKRMVEYASDIGCTYEEIPLEHVLNPDVRIMYEWLQTEGYVFNFRNFKKMYPTTDFVTWATSKGLIQAVGAQ